MNTYKGNAGNLMQHWTLCEIVDIADEANVPGLSFIDAHAMAPCAEEPDDNPGPSGPLFLSARAALPGQQSVYERAWYQLASNECYPNSANFVQHVWTRDFSMLLCEKDPSTVTALDAWLPSVRSQPRCKRIKAIPGDWLETFDEGLPSPDQVELPEGSLTLVSFDPNMYNQWTVSQRNPFVLYPDDLRQAAGQLNRLDGGVIVQLSTYSTDYGNSQGDVQNSVYSILTPNGFTQHPVVRVSATYSGKAMMSLVYTRDVPAPLSKRLKNLPCDFNKWFSKIAQLTNP